MEPTVFIKPIEGNLTDCVRACFDAFGGVDEIIKGNVFLKINATMPVLNAITDPEVILSTIDVVKEANERPKKIYVFDNSCVGSFTRLVFSVPDKTVLETYKRPLHCKGIPLEPSEKVKLIRGEKVCRTGCLALGLYLIYMTHDTDLGPCVGIIGKGHSKTELDKYSGPFIINGPCAVAELKSYFDGRQAKENLTVYYINEHCNLAALVSAVLKGCDITVSDFLKTLQVSLFKTIMNYIPAKLHRVRCHIQL